MNLELGFLPEISTECTVVFQMSKNAILGFSAHCEYHANVHSGKGDSHFHVDPIGFIPGVKNQTFGFFLTPTSPFLIIRFMKDTQYVDIENKIELVNLNRVKNSYEKTLDNICDITVKNQSGKMRIAVDSVQISLSRVDMIELSGMLKRLSESNNEEEVIEIRTQKVPKVKLIIGMCDLGTVNEYDKTIYN